MLWNSLPEQLWQPDITFFWTVQMIAENVDVCLLGTQHPVSER